MEPVDFERQWLEKLSHRLRDIAGDDVEKEVMAGSEETLSAEDPEAPVEWTRGAMERLDRLLSDSQKRDVMTGCACRYPESDLVDVRGAYRQSGDIDEAVGMLKDKFVSFLRKGLGIGEDLIEKVLEAGWGLAGIREGDSIIATKIPKSGSLVEYFKETDPDKKRSLYCHCPRVRGSIDGKPDISRTYCYCGAGFYRAIWEYILGRPVEVEVLESVLSGGDACRIAIHLQGDE
jgi:hypothetical protein